MKRIITSLLLMLCIALSAHAQDRKDQNVDFQIVAQDDISVPMYRSVVSVPVYGYYTSSLNALCLSFDQAFGNVTVCIENLSTGEYVEEVINAGVAFSVIALPGASGLYHVSFVLPSGAEYFGEFEL